MNPPEHRERRGAGLPRRAEDDGPGVQEHDEAGRVTNLGRADSRDPWAQSGAWKPVPFGTPDLPPSALTLLSY